MSEEIKKIEAIFKDEQLNEVKDALEAAGFVSMTITPVRGRGRQGGISLEWRASTYRVDLLHKILLSIVVKAEDVEKVIEIITAVCQNDVTGGGGKIFVSPIEQVIRMRGGETGLNAI